MPKAVKDIELTNMPETIEGLHAYDGVFLLLRYNGRPVGKIILPSKNSKIVLADHVPEIEKAVKKQLWYAAVDHFLFADREAQTESALATIAICTHDRTDDLNRCLEALMKLQGSGHEIIVVDNAPSTDSTKKLVARYPSVKYILEERKGLDIARNRAIAESKNDIVAFTDDDALPDSDWLYKITRHFDDPLVMCVTGMTMPLEQETDAQEAIENYSPFGKGFFTKRFSFTTSHPLATGNVGAGANMALRKSLAKEIGGFDEALDAGTPTQSGGDHEFFARVLLAGYRIVYDPEAVSWHRHRRTWKEAVQAIHGYGIGVYAFWTKLFFAEKQYSILLFPKNWLLHTQLPALYRSVFKIKKHFPVSFLLAEFRGCLKGPFSYFQSRKQANQYLKKHDG